MLWSRKLNVAMVDKSEGVEGSGQLRRKCLGYVIFFSQEGSSNNIAVSTTRPRRNKCLLQREKKGKGINASNICYKQRQYIYSSMSDREDRCVDIAAGKTTYWQLDICVRSLSLSLLPTCRHCVCHTQFNSLQALLILVGLVPLVMSNGIRIRAIHCFIFSTYL